MIQVLIGCVALAMVHKGLLHRKYQVVPFFLLGDLEGDACLHMHFFFFYHIDN